jgi:hypothetical protein
MTGGRGGLIIFVAVLVACTLRADPLQNYNLYSNTPRVRIIDAVRQIDSPWESDEQYRVISQLSNDFSIQGSSLFISNRSSARMVPSRGSLTRIYTNLPQVARIDLAFSRRALNLARLVFTTPIEIPLWAESIEFWGHGHGIRHGYRIIYRDEEGQHFTLDFGTSTHYGWRRFAASIPIRAELNRPFSERYRKLFVVALVILDDHASTEQTTVLHLANLAVSRIRRTIANQKEFWQFRRLFTFDPFSLPAITTRFHGYTNFRVFPTRAMPTNLAQAAHPLTSSLSLQADWVTQGIHRVILRFRTPLRANICRRIILTVRGSQGLERIWVLVKNVFGEHFLIRGGLVDFVGWQKISLEIPSWIIQHTSNVTEKRGLFIHDILIEPSELIIAREGLDLAIGSVSVVEDTGDFLAPALEILQKW